MAIEPLFKSVLEERQALERQKDKRAQWAKALMQEKALVYSIALARFASPGDDAAIPYCGRDSTFAQLVSEYVHNGEVYLIDNDDKIVAELKKEPYPNPNVTVVKASVPDTRDVVPVNLDMVIAKDLPAYPEEHLFGFLDYHLRSGGYFMEFLLMPTNETRDNPRYPVLEDELTQGSTLVKLYQKTED